MSAHVRPIAYGPSSAADPHEGRRYGPAFWVSAGIHGGAAALLLILSFALRDKSDDKSVAVFELVAGEGDNFMATEAPSGNEAGKAADGAIDFTAPESVPNWTPPKPAPVEAEPTPVTPVQPAKPAPVTPTKAAPTPNFSQTIKSTIRQEKRKAEKEVKQQRAAEAAAEKAAAAAEAKRQSQMSYAEWQKQQGKTSKSSGATSTKPGPRIDAAGVKKGVTGAAGAGSSGAGGTALSRAEANAMEAYFSMLIQRLRENHEKPGGLSDLLNAEVQFTLTAGGTITGVRIVRSSGNSEFDQSVLDAFARVRMPARPDKDTDVQRLTFRIKEA